MESELNYSQSYISQILREVETIALIGASADPKKDSYKVMKFLLDQNYEVFPVNPNEKGTKILLYFFGSHLIVN